MLNWIPLDAGALCEALCSTPHAAQWEVLIEQVEMFLNDHTRVDMLID